MDLNIPRLSPKEALILEMLITRGEMYGLEMVSASDGRLKRGTVYVTLGRMGGKGYVEAVPEQSDSGLPQRRYRPTGLGDRVLRAWELAGMSLLGYRHEAR